MADNAWWDDLGPAFQAAIRAAERRGRLTYAELNAVLPSREVTTTEIEALLAYLHQSGIELCVDQAPA